MNTDMATQSCGDAENSQTKEGVGNGFGFSGHESQISAATWATAESLSAQVTVSPAAENSSDGGAKAGGGEMERSGAVEKERAEAAIGLPRIGVGCFSFPPESLRPEATYAPIPVVQGPGRGKKGFKHYRDGGRDCVELMELARSDASVLEEALRAMGFTEANDNFPDGECRTENPSEA